MASLSCTNIVRLLFLQLTAEIRRITAKRQKNFSEQHVEFRFLEMFTALRQGSGLVFKACREQITSLCLVLSPSAALITTGDNRFGAWRHSRRFRSNGRGDFWSTRQFDANPVPMIIKLTVAKYMAASGGGGG